MTIPNFPAVILLLGRARGLFMGRREGWLLGTFSLGITAGAFRPAIRGWPSNTH